MAQHFNINKVSFQFASKHLHFRYKVSICYLAYHNTLMTSLLMRPFIVIELKEEFPGFN